MEQKTIFIIGVDGNGKMTYDIDNNWLIDNISGEGILSQEVLQLLGMLDFAKVEIQNQLCLLRADEFEALEELNEFEDELRGGLDQIKGIDFNDEDDIDSGY